MKKILAFIALALINSGAYAASDIRMEGNQLVTHAALHSNKLQVTFGSPPMQSTVNFPLNDDYSPKNAADLAARGLSFRRSQIESSWMELRDKAGVLFAFQLQ